MAHEYSVLIHEWISRKKENLDRQIKETETGNDKADYHRGQLDELMAIRQYLTEKIDLATHTYYD
jgi:predicted aminopeptidase